MIFMIVPVTLLMIFSDHFSHEVLALTAVAKTPGFKPTVSDNLPSLGDNRKFLKKFPPKVKIFVIKQPGDNKKIIFPTREVDRKQVLRKS